MAKFKFFKKITRPVLRSAPVVGLLSWLIFLYVKFVGITTKWKISGLAEVDKLVSQKKNFIALTWHGRAAMTAFFFKKEYNISALVSPHHDGRLVAGLLHRYGLKTIDGSSNRNASGAALELMRSLKKDRSIGIIPDGPRGPRQRMSKSPIYYASKTGCPIICAMYSVKGSKVIKKSWDNMLFPFPFSKGILLVHEPVYIPRSLTDEQIETHRKKIEDILNKLQYDADNYTGIEQILPQDKIKEKKYKKEKV